MEILTENTTLVFIFIISLGFIIRSIIKGTFWRSNLTSGMGGAILGIVITSSFFLFLMLASTSAGHVWMEGIIAMIAIPIAAIVGAMLFISIGVGKRKKHPLLQLQSTI